jgi:regulatory protein
MDDFEKFYKASINFLSFRPRSEKEMREYLLRHKTKDVRDKIDEKIIERIIESLKKSKFIDDEEFARRFVEQRTKIKPKANRIIKYELKQKGISRELIDQLFEDKEESETADFAKALELTERKMRTIHDQSNKFKVKEKLGRYLASKGFDWDTIKDVIDQILAK